MKHQKLILELKAAITSFQTKDMDELIKFHKHVEQNLEKLTDETQVNLFFYCSLILTQSNAWFIETTTHGQWQEEK